MNKYQLLDYFSQKKNPSNKDWSITLDNFATKWKCNICDQQFSFPSSTEYSAGCKPVSDHADLHISQLGLSVYL